jgi:hypothetical protein
VDGNAVNSSAEDNQNWIRELIKARGWTEAIENEARERLMPAVPNSPEGPAHPNEVCACCKGSATKLKEDLNTTTYDHPVYICADRETCRSMMIYDHMIANTKGA